ncbi:hypothetical protein ABZ802_26090 [Streptomyces sp. NPDC047737]|uniref:hypothetical protein n=1 Tax=unclassified Streptomyces TaxID=2593676 RepID=UPI0033D24151
MADEQHQWLDADAAEMLLRGDAVEPVGEHARAEARRLDAALRTLRTPEPSGAELPGEAAVLAAFREASRGGERSGSASAAGPVGRQEAPHTVRIGNAPEVPLRRPRWTRPVRFGLAVSLAGCALGGVAFAGGTGVLPTPFGGEGPAAPAVSVSAAATPEELGAELPDAGAPSAAPSLTPGASASPAPSDTSGGADAGTADEEEKDGDGTPGRDRDRETGTAGGGTQDGTDGRRPGESAAEVYARSVRACRGYRDDTLSEEDERRLLELADGERNLDRFCDRLLDGDDRGEDSGGDGGPGQDDDEGNGGKKGEGAGGNGTLPSVIFRTQSPESVRSPEDAPSAGGTRPVGGTLSSGGTQGGARKGGETVRPTDGSSRNSAFQLSSVPL